LIFRKLQDERLSFFQQNAFKTKHPTVPKKISLAIKSMVQGWVFSKRNYITLRSMYPYPVSGFVGTIPK
jgi:hypothetical protein